MYKRTVGDVRAFDATQGAHVRRDVTVCRVRHMWRCKKPAVMRKSRHDAR